MLIDGSVEDPGSKTLLSSFGVGNGLFAHPLSEGVLQLGLLDEQVVFGAGFGGCLRCLQVEGQPLLDA